MANNKVGLDYFELDCQMEEKVRLIQAEFGLKGFAVVVKLYQKIYGEFGYYCEWSEDSLLLFMSENGVPSDSKKLIQEIVSACIRRNIFSEKLFNKFGILTSYGVQKRYMNATSRREKVSMKKEYLLLEYGKINRNVDITEDSVNIMGEDVNIISQSRVEESRVEKSNKEKRRSREKELAVYFQNDLLNRTFFDFVKMRKEIKKPMTDRAIELAIKKLESLCKTSSGESEQIDEEMAIKILEQSIMNCWQGLFPLKEGKQGAGRKNSFNQFAQNEYDFAALENELLSN